MFTYEEDLILYLLTFTEPALQIYINHIRRVMPKIIADEIMGVAPTKPPTWLLFFTQV